MRENDFLAWIASQTPPHAGVAVGVGDDMAGVRVGGALALLKIDQALDQVHFDLRQHTPGQAGRKAVNRCLSDCAAMACRPAAILVAVALPRGATAEFAQELFLGCRDAAGVFDCPLVGGDTAVWDQRLAITVAALGWNDPAAAPAVLRSGAQAGDAICVSGQLGGSILGRHLTFTPRIALARELVRLAPIHAMMDLSDGLAQDLPRLCAASGVGATVEARWLPVHADAWVLAGQDRRSAMLHALTDGEDYELLFTLPEAALPQLISSLKSQASSLPAITRIGTVTSSPALQLLDEHGQLGPFPTGGWEHTSG